jgi:hypothetical protein
LNFLKAKGLNFGFVDAMPIAELFAKARHFHALVQTTSDPVTKERLLRLAENYRAQADQLKSERKVIQAAYPKSAARDRKSRKG